MIFATYLNLFSIRTIVIPTHIELVPKLAYIIDFSIAQLVPKQHVELICIFVVNLIIPPDIIKQHLPETFLHLEVGEMIINETLIAWE